jgi:hypothetical protein
MLELTVQWANIRVLNVNPVNTVCLQALSVPNVQLENTLLVEPRCVSNANLANMLLPKDLLFVKTVLLVLILVMLVSVNANLVAWDIMPIKQALRDVWLVLAELLLLRMALVLVLSALLVNTQVLWLPQNVQIVPRVNMLLLVDQQAAIAVPQVPLQKLLAHPNVKIVSQELLVVLKRLFAALVVQVVLLLWVLLLVRRARKESTPTRLVLDLVPLVVLETTSLKQVLLLVKCVKLESILVLLQQHASHAQLVNMLLLKVLENA